MTLENYESWQATTENMLVVFATIAGLIGAFYNQRMIDTTIKRERDVIRKNLWEQRLILWVKMHTKEWWGFVICSTIVIGLSFLHTHLASKIKILEKDAQAKIDRKKQKEQDTRDSILQATYFGQIRILQEDSRREREETKIENQLNILEVTGNMSKRFSEGTKQIISNTDDKSKSIFDKIDSNKLKPAHVALIAEPHNVFEIEYRNDTIHFTIRIKNYGDLPAYNLNTRDFFIAEIGNTYYTLNISEQDFSETLLANTTRIMRGYVQIDSSVYNSMKSFYCVVLGDYYIGEDKKTRKVIVGAKKLLNKTFEPASYDLNMSIRDFLKSCIPYVE